MVQKGYKKGAKRGQKVNNINMLYYYFDVILLNIFIYDYNIYAL